MDKEVRRIKGLRTLDHNSTHEHLHTNTHTSCISRDSSWRIHCGVEVTGLTTNIQHTFSRADLKDVRISSIIEGDGQRLVSFALLPLV